MSIEIRMPRMADSMTHGAVITWRKQEGESVRAGEVIAEIEVDKATVDLEAPEAGTLTTIFVPAGSEKVGIGEVLAILDKSEGAADRITIAETRAPAAASTNAPSRDHGHSPVPAESAPVSARTILTNPAIPISDVEVAATPLARSMASQAGVNLSAIHGTGPAGRVVQADVLAALGYQARAKGVKPPTLYAAPEPLPVDSAGAYDEIPHSRIRQVIAQRLSESKQTIPHFYLEVNCRVDALLQVRSEIQAAEGGLKLSLNDFAIRAAALALRKVPDANASWTDPATRRYRRIDLAIAVATKTGLVAPVVRDADRKGLSVLAAEIHDLAERARQGRLRYEELQGGTFTVSNLGMYGIDALYAIINPPQAGILGLGAAEPRPVADAGSVVVATMMTCTLSADHRVLDGATAARFLTTFKEFIEQPMTMSL
jgi:pyruvate dehydrogenase E2 component (dihydrolipoamide acetyltransferase)